MMISIGRPTPSPDSRPTLCINYKRVFFGFALCYLSFERHRIKKVLDIFFNVQNRFKAMYETVNTPGLYLSTLDENVDH